MVGKRRFEAKIAALDGIRQQPEQDRVEPLRKALAHRNNFLVAKAADLGREFKMKDLAPELLRAFDRFLENPVKTDPQCWAKNAISRALAAIEYQESESFFVGCDTSRWNRSGEAAPILPELCGPSAPWRSCSAAISVKTTCSSTSSNCWQTKTKRCGQTWFVRSSRWARRRLPCCCACEPC